MRYLTPLFLSLALCVFAHAGQRATTVAPIKTVAVPATTLGFNQLSPVVGAQIPQLNVDAKSMTPAALAPALALRPVAQSVEAFAAQPLSPVEQSMAALEAFNETFQAAGADFSGEESQAALSAIYEGAAKSKAKGDNAPAAPEIKVSPLAPQGAVDEIIEPVKRKTKARLSAFEREVKKVKSGRFGLASVWQKPDASGRLGIRFEYTLDGRLLGAGDLKRKIAAGAVTKAAFEKAKPALDKEKKRLARAWDKLQDENKADVMAAKKEVAKVAKRLHKERLAIGRDLQAWGVPNVAAVGLEGWLKYVRVYRLGGQPTDLGVALHGLLAPMVAKDPKILGRITQQGLDTAVLEISRGLRYRKDPQSDDMQKTMRLGSLVDEGHDYPEWREAFFERARKALADTGPKTVPKAGLRLKPLNEQPTPVLKTLLNEVFKQLALMVQAQAPAKQTARGFELVRALHAALALPFGPDGFQSVQHKQLMTILPNLQAMGVHEDVITAVIRSYPLGESLWRLGIPKLWAAGLTGRGVKVAVIDNGVTFAHPDFEGVKKKSVNFTRDRGDDTLGDHGTPMADIIHAIAPEAELMSYQVLSNSDLPGVMLSGEETDAALMKALNMAEKDGAKIISMSLGAAYGLANDKFAKRIAQLKAKGIVVIVSAGNAGDELPPGMQVGSPGSGPAALTVGAVDYHNRKADFSSKGPVFNPDNPVNLKDKPDIYAFGVNNKAAMALPSALYDIEPVPYNHVSGTSPATPHVSGVVALMLEAARYAGFALDGSIAGVVKSALLATATQSAYRSDLPAIPVMLDAQAAVDKFLEKLKKQ